MSTYIENVQRGMALLDEKLPGWERRVNLDSLHLSSCTQCVVGQLFRAEPRALGASPIEPDPYGEAYFVEGVRRLGAGDDDQIYGFTLDDGQNWGGLTRTWKRLIRARLAAVTP